MRGGLYNTEAYFLLISFVICEVLMTVNMKVCSPG